MPPVLSSRAVQPHRRFGIEKRMPNPDPPVSLLDVTLALDQRIFWSCR